MITPRTTQLVRTADLRAFRRALVDLAGTGTPLDARNRIIVVPTRAAAAHLLRTLEDQAFHASACSSGAMLLPDLITPAELVTRLADRLDVGRPVLTDAEREVLLGVACRAARDAGFDPPFRLRPGLIAEILRFYDTLRWNQNDIDAFERRALDKLEPGAAYDRGAERLVRQTRFLVAAYRDFELRCAAAGLDDHELRRRLLQQPAANPVTHVVLAVGDRAFDPHGLYPADWDLLARVPGLARLDVVVTDRVLAGALHERMHQVLPGIEEVRVDAPDSWLPVLVVPPPGRRDGEGSAPLVHVSRDREEEIGGFARRVKAAVRERNVTSLDRIALVVHQPLPYVYVAREVLRSGGIPCQMFDALPLAAEPYAAALDLVCSAVTGDFARAPAIALLRSPHFRIGGDGEPRPFGAGDVAALDRALGEAGYLGDADALERLLDSWRAAAPSRGRLERALRAGEALLHVARSLAPLRRDGTVAEHLTVLTQFLTRHENLPGPDEDGRTRQLRARSAVLGTLAGLRDAYRRFDSTPLPFDEVAALVRRWIEGHTFAPRTGDAGVHLVDADSARFGEFEEIQLAGLIDGEWPARPRRSIFYSAGVLRELGWPAEAGRIDGARAAFTDLLRLPRQRLAVSSFSLEADSIVGPSPLLDELDIAAPDRCVEQEPDVAVFDFEALTATILDAAVLPALTREWAAFRVAAPPLDAPRYHGATTPPPPAALSLSALERYQDCPFKFFAADVLRLEEQVEDETGLSPRARGRFIHEVFQQFFAAWDAAGHGTITSDQVDRARTLFAAVAEPLLSRLPDADAGLERTRLFGSAISVGIVDVVLGLEASRPAEVTERWLEYRLEGEFSLGIEGGATVALKGVADRIDLLAGNRLRVIDYKSGMAPNTRRALQVPIYALCAKERLEERDGASWTVDEAAYVAFAGKRSLVPVVKAGATDATAVLDDARERLLGVLDGIGGGAFPPRPHDAMRCRYCAYSVVCRKDYVGDE